ncbi:UspA domain protein [Patulibacter medicamentivorans]|uniref:UspA domain protein n=1 Tax=Patulibacter medicamentivorans TaxID=1097667 RepID=H0E178_9ACTN|nr:universal stress protein [Patulibacter medicamentivorans]EHN12517.1 UspA domain protein [Patulibacter medicamentivorans]
MFHRILVGFDGTPASHGALRLAQHLASPDATLIVASVVLYDPGVGRAATVDIEPYLRDDGDATLDAARALIGERPDTEYTAPVATSVAAGLHRVARETLCDLIVIGASRRRGVGRVLLGSDAEATLHGAPCAVAVAPPAPGDSISRIGVAFDGTAAGRRAVAAAGALAADRGAALTVLSVVDTRHVYATFGPDGGYGDLRSQARDLTTDALAQVHGVPSIRRQLHEGDPVHEILSLARDVDLLVLGSRDNGPLLRLLLGSVSSSVVRRTRCATVIVPEKAPVPLVEAPSS